MAKRLAGKSALITGACSGIGLATSRVFAQVGAWLSLVDIQNPSAIARALPASQAGNARMLRPFALAAKRAKKTARA